MELKNRIVMTAMHLNYIDGGYVNDRLVHFYTRRAEGGVGLIIVGACCIDKDTSSLTTAIDGDRYIPGLKRLSDSIKRHGAKVAAQIAHMGASAWSSMIGGRQPVSASAVQSTLTGETPRALELEEIVVIQDKYVQAAVRARDAGFDAVEIQGGYLINQFLSPLSNIRKDKYGASLSDRMRFGVETVEKVRAAVGTDYPLLMRVGGSEFIPGGCKRSDVQTFAVELEKAGVDLLNITGGPHETRVPQITMAVPRRAFAYLAQGIKSAVSIPVLASNRINDPADGEDIIRNGEADLVTMARALITDPDLPNKAREGKSDRIYHCIGCNQGCLDMLFRTQPVTCMLNPSAGMEKECQVSPASKPKKVLIIGGGPAGMKAACTAAERGHLVSLVEKEAQLGGQLLLNRLIPDRSEMVTAATDLINNLKAVNVRILLGQEVDAKFIKEFAPDVIVMATGAKPVDLSLPGNESDNVFQAWEVLAGKVCAGHTVTIIGGNAVGLETALYLANQGTLSAEVLHFLTVHRAETPEALSGLLNNGNKNVTVVEMTGRTGQDIGASTRWILKAELRRLGVTVKSGTTAVRIIPEGLEVETAEGPDFLPADTIVIAAGSKSENRLIADIKELVPEYYTVGDAKQPRNALFAIREGFLTGLKI